MKYWIRELNFNYELLKLETRVSRFSESTTHITKFKTAGVQGTLDLSEPFWVNAQTHHSDLFFYVYKYLGLHEYHQVIKEYSLRRSYRISKVHKLILCVWMSFWKQRWQIRPRPPVILKKGKVWQRTECLPSKFPYFKFLGIRSVLFLPGTWILISKKKNV